MGSAVNYLSKATQMNRFYIRTVMFRMTLCDFLIKLI